MYKTFLAALVCLIYTSHCFGQEAWTLNTHQDGIKVYTRSVANSKFKAIRVECEMDASLSQLVAALLDVGTCTDWVYHTKSCRLLKQVSPSELYYYSEVSVPWPAENRDFVAHVIFSQNPVTKAVIMDAPCVQGWVPVKKGTIRVEHSIGKWVITPAGRNHVKIEYELQTDPGGDTPAWLINMFVAQGPLQSFEKLRSEIQKPAYKNARISFIKDE